MQLTHNIQSLLPNELLVWTMPSDFEAMAKLVTKAMQLVAIVTIIRPATCASAMGLVCR